MSLLHLGKVFTKVREGPPQLEKLEVKYRMWGYHLGNYHGWDRSLPQVPVMGKVAYVKFDHLRAQLELSRKQP